jgi:hypothetical protein
MESVKKERRMEVKISYFVFHFDSNHQIKNSLKREDS